MQIQRHPSNVQDIGTPSDMQNDCSPLPVTYLEDEFGVWALSFWKPTAEELANLNADGSVVLMVRAAGRQHPVVSVRTTPDATVPA